MMAHSKFLVLLAIFLSANLGNAFVSQAWPNHLIQFDALKSNPTIKPIRVPTCEPTNERMKTNKQTTNQRLEWNAKLSNVLSSNQEQQGCIQNLCTEESEINSELMLCANLKTELTSYSDHFQVQASADQMAFGHNKLKLNTALSRTSSSSSKWPLVAASSLSLSSSLLLLNHVGYATVKNQSRDCLNSQCSMK